MLPAAARFSFFFLCLVRRPLPFFLCSSSLLRVVAQKIFGSELLFLGVGVGHVLCDSVLAF